MSIGDRIREERTRLGLTQTELGAAVGGSMRGVQGWERDVSAPNATYLTVMASMGIDVSYVLTGWRMAPDQVERYRAAAVVTLSVSGDAERKARLQALFVESAANGRQDLALSADERALVQNFRAADDSGRAAIAAAGAALAKKKPDGA